MFAQSRRFLHIYTTHPDRIIYMSQADERKHWLYWREYAATLSLGVRIYACKIQGFRVYSLDFFGTSLGLFRKRKPLALWRDFKWQRICWIRVAANMFQDCVLVWTLLRVLSLTSFHNFWTAEYQENQDGCNLNQGGTQNVKIQGTEHLCPARQMPRPAKSFRLYTSGLVGGCFSLNIICCINIIWHLWSIVSRFSRFIQSNLHCCCLGSLTWCLIW